MGENFARAVRKAAGLTQAQMAQAIGRSHQMVQQYEKGAPLPEDVLAKLQALAGHADAVVELKPKHVTAETHPERARMHALLDDIINSGDPEAINAVNSNLIVFGKYVKRAETSQKRRAKQ